MNKASGGDGIPVELFQILTDDAVKVLRSICQQIWKTQQWPQDWKRSVFIPIPKKGNVKNPQSTAQLHSSHWGFPGGSDGKESACNAEDLDSISGLGRSPGGGHGNPRQYLAWKIPWTEEPGRLQSDTTERLHFHFLCDWNENWPFPVLWPLLSYPHLLAY